MTAEITPRARLLRLLPLAVAVALSPALAGGCGGMQAQAGGEGPGGLVFLREAFTPGVVQAVEGDDEDAAPAPAARGGTDELKFVEKALRRRGIRFGTDGTFGGLLSYFEYGRGDLVDPVAARKGDVVFFDIGGRRCADHGGVVESVDRGGRIAFRESRGGVVRLSYVHPRERALRRGPDGRILNTFLRPRLPDDPPDARYFAGEMLCAVGRLRPR